MTEAEVQDVLAASRLGYLGLCADKLAYVIPLFFGYDRKAVYFQCHPGLKDMYIEGTEEACLEVAHYESQHVWESVQVFGPIEKLTLNDDIAAAKNALFQVPYPPLPGSFPGGLPKRHDAQMFYLRLTVTRWSGRKSEIREPPVASP